MPERTEEQEAGDGCAAIVEAQETRESREKAAEHVQTAAASVSVDFRGRLLKLTSLNESPLCSSDESTDISTPEHSPRCGRTWWSISTPRASPDSWSALTPDPSSCSRGTPLQGVPACMDLSSKTPSVAPVSPVGAIVLPQSPVPNLALVPSSGFFEGGFTFTFTLRLADDHGLGLDVAAATASRQFLVVQQVLNEGAIEAWNRRCLDGSQSSMKVVQHGDVIARVNEKTDCQAMLEECREKMLLKLTIVRRFPGYFTNFRASAAGYVPWVGPDGICHGHEIGHLVQHSQTCSLGEGERLHASKLPVVI